MNDTRFQELADLIEKNHEIVMHRIDQITILLNRKLTHVEEMRSELAATYEIAREFHSKLHEKDSQKPKWWGKVGKSGGKRGSRDWS